MFYFVNGESLIFFAWLIHISVSGFLLNNPKLASWLSYSSLLLFIASYIITHVIGITIIETRANPENILYVEYNFLFILTAFSILTFIYYQFTKAALQTKLEDAEIDILYQKAVLDLKQVEINKSMRYAKLIQDSVLVKENKTEELFAESFLFFKPKTFVSGDFYWCTETESAKIILVADCTGHGIPGAFMSLIGNTLLNQIIINEHIEKPSEILNRLQEEVSKTLQQENAQDRSSDGMDVAVLSFEKGSNKLLYCSAGRPLYYVRDEKLIQINQRSHGIGLEEQYRTKAYIDDEILGRKGDMYYLFSDGFTDQFGEETGKKFLLRRLRELFLEVANKSVEEQLEIIENTFYNWKGEQSQIDDVTVLGIKY